MPRPPRKWTAEEDEILSGEVAAQFTEDNKRDWRQIATKLPGRTNKDCRKRWVNTIQGESRKGRWTKKEDEQLLRSIDKYGQRWASVAEDVTTRTADQCAKRWQQFLNPIIDHSEWTLEEDDLLLQAFDEFGRRWKEIQLRKFPHRSRNSVKNRFTILQRRGNRGAVSVSDSSERSDTSISDGEDDEEDQAYLGFEDALEHSYGINDENLCSNKPDRLMLGGGVGTVEESRAPMDQQSSYVTSPLNHESHYQGELDSLTSTLQDRNNFSMGIRLSDAEPAAASWNPSSAEQTTLMNACEYDDFEPEVCSRAADLDSASRNVTITFNLNNPRPDIIRSLMVIASDSNATFQVDF